MTVEEIRQRLARVPHGYWHSALGSGEHMMTAVMCDGKEGEGQVIFIADVLPEYKADDSRAWENRNPLLDFISNAPTDIQFLLDSLSPENGGLAPHRMRPVVRAFAEAMEEKMLANDYRGGWNIHDYEYVWRQLHEHVGKLTFHIANGDTERTLSDAADVGNLALILCDILGALPVTAIAPANEEEAFKDTEGSAKEPIGEQERFIARQAQEIARLRRRIAAKGTE